MFKNTFDIFNYIFDLESKEFEKKEEKNITGLITDITETYKIKEDKDSVHELKINWDTLRFTNYEITERLGSGKHRKLYSGYFDENMDRRSETRSNQKLFLSVADSLTSYIQQHGSSEYRAHLHKLYIFIETIMRIQSLSQLNHVHYEFTNKNTEVEEIIAVMHNNRDLGIKIGIEYINPINIPGSHFRYYITKLMPVLSIHENKTVEWVIPKGWDVITTISPDGLIKLIEMFHK